jgi:glycosyltransferase involved in cell wall biosynthesis
MKILLVSTQDYIHHPLPSRHHHIFEELAKRHEVHVPHFHLHTGNPRETRLHVHEATMFNIKDPVLHYVLNAPYHYHVFKQIIRDEKIDVVVAAHVLAGLAAVKAAKKYNVPVLFDLKDWFPDSAAAYYKNSFMKYVLEKGVWWILKHRPKLITNGVDTNVFKQMDMRNAKEQIGYVQTDFVIGFCGAIERWYDLKHVISCVADLTEENENVKLLIVGTSLFTNYEDELKELAHDLNIEDKVRFEGLCEYETQPRYIAAMDVCLIPLASKEWKNIAAPNKYFEYTACGKPILSSLIPALEDAPNVMFYADWSEFKCVLGELTKKC